MLPIPVSKTYTASIHGSIHRLVECEQCNREFIYRAWRSASGDATSYLFLNEAGAEMRANRQVECEWRNAAKRVLEVVPCPGCGWIQSEMIPVARSRYRRRAKMAGIILLTFIVVPVSILAGALWPPIDQRNLGYKVFEASLLICILLVSGLYLLVRRARELQNLNPNAEPVEERIQKGKELAQLLPVSPPKANSDDPIADLRMAGGKPDFPTP